MSKETIFRIEARAILKSLQITWVKGYRKFEIECDNVLLVEFFLAGSVANSNLAELQLIN
ncbi:hypothetical protein Goklo_012628, partial [Gossypium klotzschianum]|nr:hypothetical protein [Gossypium klotzschianum]